MLVPSMLSMADVMDQSGYTEEQVFDLGISQTIVFLVVVPLLGAFKVPDEALSHFMAGADDYTADAMPEHWSGALSGKWTIKRDRLRILPASWDGWVTYTKDIEKIKNQAANKPQPEPGELCMLMDVSIYLATQRGWQNSVREKFLRDMMEAAAKGKLTVYDPEIGTTRLPKFGANCPDEFTTPEDVNKWLLSRGRRLTWVLDRPVVQAAHEEDGSASDCVKSGNVDWRNVVRAEAYEQWVKTLAENGTPTLENVSKYLTHWCEANEVKTDTGKFPKASYLKIHVIDGKHWEPPRNMSREAAKKHLEQKKQDKQAN